MQSLYLLIIIIINLGGGAGAGGVQTRSIWEMCKWGIGEYQNIISHY